MTLVYGPKTRYNYCVDKGLRPGFRFPKLGVVRGHRAAGLSQRMVCWIATPTARDCQPERSDIVQFVLGAPHRVGSGRPANTSPRNAAGIKVPVRDRRNTSGASDTGW